MYTKTDIILLRLIFMFFKFFGLAPITINKVTKKNRRSKVKIITLICSHSWIGIIYNIILSIYSLLMICFLTSFLLYTTTDIAIDTSFTLALFVGCNIFVMTTSLIYVLRQRTIVLIINQLFYVDTILFGQLINICQHKTAKYKQIIMFILYITATIVVFTTQMFRSRDEQLWLITFIPTFFLSWIMLQYAFIIIYLEKMFKRLNKSLELFTNSDNVDKYFQNAIFHVSKILNNTMLKDIICMRTAHSMLHEISKKIADFYSTPIIFAISSSYLLLIYNVYDCITTILLSTKAPPQILVIINACFWIIIAALPIIFLTSSITELITEVCIHYILINKTI